MHVRYDKTVPLENSDKFLKIIQSKEVYFESFEGDHNDERRKDIFYKMFNFILHHNGINN